MTIDPRTYPSRAFIQFMAENQLRADLTGRSFTASVRRLGGESYVQEVNPNNSTEPISEAPEDCRLDEALFAEIAKTIFNPNRYPELYQSCGTQRAAQAFEGRVVDELVETYRRIKRQQQCPIVQKLNDLL